MSVFLNVQSILSLDIVVASILQQSATYHRFELVRPGLDSVEQWNDLHRDVIAITTTNRTNGKHPVKVRRYNEAHKV